MLIKALNLLSAVEIKLLAFWNRFFPRKKQKLNPPVTLTAERFLQAFLDHGVIASQIPTLLPQVRLNDLKSVDTLLPVLNPELLENVAKLFGIRVEWLRGEDDVIYESHSCYKHPEDFFKDLSALTLDYSDTPVRILARDKNFDYTLDQWQPLALIVLEKIAELGDKGIYRYRVYDNQWKWDNSTCRIQLKAMARLLFKKLRIVIPIYNVSLKELNEIGEGRRIPTEYVLGCQVTDPSLEDYALTSEESSVAKEVEELPKVLDYIEQYKLESYVPKRPERKEAEPDTEPSIPANTNQKEKAQKAGAAKSEPGNKLKQTFIEKYAARIQAGEITQAEAARAFYDALNETEMMQLCRSPKDYENGTADELRIRAVRTLSNAYRDHKKPNS